MRRSFLPSCVRMFSQLCRRKVKISFLRRNTTSFKCVSALLFIQKWSFKGEIIWKNCLMIIVCNKNAPMKVIPLANWRP